MRYEIINDMIEYLKEEPAPVTRKAPPTLRSLEVQRVQNMARSDALRRSEQVFIDAIVEAVIARLQERGLVK